MDLAARVELLEERLAAIEDSGDGDSIAPNFLRFMPDGTTRADFDGHVHAQGVDLDAVLDYNTGPENAVQWSREDNGALVGVLKTQMQDSTAATYLRCTPDASLPAFPGLASGHALVTVETPKGRQATLLVSAADASNAAEAGGASSRRSVIARTDAGDIIIAEAFDRGIGFASEGNRSQFGAWTSWAAPTMVWATNYGSGYPALRWRACWMVDGSRIIQFRGLAKLDSLSSPGSARYELCQLPDPWRPAAATQVMASALTGSGGPAELVYYPDGTLRWMAYGDCKAWVNLDGVQIAVAG